MAGRRRMGAPEPEPFKFDPSPMYACDIVDLGTGIKVVVNWMAFDPSTGPETEEQIEWHRAHDTPGAADWEIGKPVKTPRVYP